MSINVKTHTVKERKFSVGIVSADDTRTSGSIVNNSANTLLLKYSIGGESVTTSDYDYLVAPGATHTIADAYQHVITGRWVGSGVEGFAEVEEVLSPRYSPQGYPIYETSLPPADQFGVGFAVLNDVVYWSNRQIWISLGEGVPGEPGTSIVLKGVKVNAAALPTTGNTDGDMWITDDDGHGHVWYGTEFTDAGVMRGPAGAPGPMPTGARRTVQSEVELNAIPSNELVDRQEIKVASDAPGLVRVWYATDGVFKTRRSISVDIDDPVLQYSLSSSLSSPLALNEAVLADDVWICLSDATNVLNVRYVLDNNRKPVVEDSPFSLPLTAAEHTVAQDHTISARVEYENGWVSYISASFSSQTAAPPNEVRILGDNSSTVDLVNGSTAQDILVALGNLDGDEVVYVGTSDSSWMGVTVVGSQATLTLSGVSSLANGEYTGTVVFTSGDLIPAVYQVRLRVSSAIVYNIIKSVNADFTNYSALDGSILQGAENYLGIFPLTGISSVKWGYNSTDVVERTVSPYDFQATPDAATPAVFDTSVLPNGNNSITATITPTGGGTNYLPQSRTPNTGLGTLWTVFQSAFDTNDTITGIYGTAYLWKDTVNSGQHIAKRVTSKAAESLPFTIAFAGRVKPGTDHSWIMLEAKNANDSGHVQKKFDFATGTIGNTGILNAAAGWTITGATMISYGVDGDYVVTLSGTTDNSATVDVRVFHGNSSTSVNYTGTGVGGFYWEGASLEFSATHGPYVDTLNDPVIGSGVVPITVTANVNIQNVPKVLTASASQVSFIGAAGASSPTAKTIEILSSIGTAAGTTVELVDAPWLSATATWSSVVGTPAVITITPNTGSLVQGSYTTTLRFSAVGYASVDVAILFNVEAALPDLVMYGSPNGVGVAPITVVQASTRTAPFACWLAEPATQATPYVVQPGDGARCWLHALPDSEEEAQKALAEFAFTAGQSIIFKNNGNNLQFPTTGPQSMHWRYFDAQTNTYKRGNASLTYGTALRHKGYGKEGIYLSADGFGYGTLRAEERTFLAHPGCMGADFMMKWNQFELASSTAGTPVFSMAIIDQLKALVAFSGKPIIIMVSCHRGAAPTWIKARTYDAGYRGNDILCDNGTGPNATSGGWQSVNFFNSLVFDRYKLLMRTISDYIDNDDSVLAIVSPESYFHLSANFTAATGIREVPMCRKFSECGYQTMNDEPKKYRRTFLFWGQNEYSEPGWPGGTYASAVNTGFSAGFPDSMMKDWNTNPTFMLTADRKVHRVYKGQIAGMCTGDMSNLGIGTRPDGSPYWPAHYLADMARVQYEFNVEPNKFGITGNNEDSCARLHFLALPIFGSTLMPPSNPNILTQHFNLLDWIVSERNAGRKWPNSLENVTNLAFKT